MIVALQKHSSDEVDSPARYASGRPPSSPASGGGVGAGGRSVSNKATMTGAVPSAATDVTVDAKLQVYLQHCRQTWATLTWR